MTKKKPHFTIKNNSQKGGYRYSDILTPKILQDVCIKTTGHGEFTYEFDNTSYNKGRLAIIEYDGKIIYVSFSETGKISGRNYFFQSFPTALTKYHSEKNPKKRICFYFLSSDGNIATDYFMFMYRLMATANVEFLNPKVIKQKIFPFNSVEDIIVHKEKIRSRNKSNNSTYITRNPERTAEIYAKTYGANKYESVLLCLATSTLENAKLYEISEQNLKELPEPSLKVIKSLGNIEVIPTDLTMEKQYLADNISLRSPKFNLNLLEKLGAKKCVFCGLAIPAAIAGAHIWPVSDIVKRHDLTIKAKINFATDGDNGIWLCENHHEMFDRNLIRISENGELKILSTLDENHIKFIKRNTPNTKIDEEIIVGNFVQYLKKRNRLLPEKNYVSL